MITKTTIVLRDSLLILLYTCCWLLALLNVWTLHTFVIVYLVLALIFSIVLRKREDIFGKVRYLVSWVLVGMLFIFQRPDIKSNELGVDNFRALAGWLKLAHIAIFLAGAAILISKIYEDGKYSETQAEKELGKCQC